MPTETQHLEQRVAALQSDLNERDQRIDDLSVSDNDRELSRRSWFDEANRLRNELGNALEENGAIRLQAGGMQMEIDELGQKLAERDALLLRITGSDHQDSLRAIGEAAALSASAEPSAPMLCGQHQGEPVAWTWSGALEELKNGARAISVYRNEGPGTPVALYTRPAEQPETTTSDKYCAELYDEVWQLARDMGFGNVTDALKKLSENPAR